MGKTLIAISSYGGLPFLELCLRGIQETLTRPADIFVVVAKPNDHEMVEFLTTRGIPFKADVENRGFASNVNDMYDRAFVHGDYANLIICGNDIVPMPGALDAMINTALTTEWEMVCGSEFNAQFLVNNYAAARRYFRGENLVFTDFKARPWEMHTERRDGIEPHARKDIRNMTLFKRIAFEKTGYADVNFWPNGYFEDNDACLRSDKLGVSACGLAEAAFFHFVSRTIHQNAQRDHGGYFSRNSGHYLHKWGGPVGGERYAMPYDGRGMNLDGSEIFLAPDLKIATRDQENAIIDYWRSK